MCEEKSWTKKQLINLVSKDEGVFYHSCAHAG